MFNSNLLIAARLCSSLPYLEFKKNHITLHLVERFMLKHIAVLLGRSELLIPKNFDWNLQLQRTPQCFHSEEESIIVQSPDIKDSKIIAHERAQGPLLARDMDICLRCCHCPTRLLRHATHLSLSQSLCHHLVHDWSDLSSLRPQPRGHQVRFVPRW
jgi:hypothetical protein